jgi:hypothetical protein
MLSTDKPVYQPGQVIRMRGLALRRPDHRPVAGQTMVFSVTDPRGNVVFRQRGVTSAFGISAGDCALADELIEGPYQVECRLGEIVSRATVDVQRYVLPRLKVEIDTDQPFYAPGAVLRGNVRARYVHGEPVRRGTATVVLTADVIGPKPLGSWDLTLDEDGKAALECPLPDVLAGRPQEAGDARVAVAVTVRDPAGQTQSRTITRVVTANPIRIEVIPEAGTLVAGRPNTIHVLTTLPDGRPAQARVRIAGFDHELPTNELGVADFAFTPRGDGGEEWTVEATDAAGHTGRRTVKLECGQPGSEYLVRTDKAVYRGGEPLRVVALGGGREPVFLDLIKDGQTVLSESIAMDGGRGALEMTLPAELSGPIELCAYRYGPDGLPVHKSRIIYVQPASALKIQTTFDRAEYRPGDRAHLAIALCDAQGKPAPGAVSLAAVDEAVFAVREQRPGLERTFFALEQELLRPVYEIHD